MFSMNKVSMLQFYNNSRNSEIAVTGFLQTKPSHTYTVGILFLSGRSDNNAGAPLDGG
jgi:hypothetical protein